MILACVAGLLLKRQCNHPAGQDLIGKRNDSGVGAWVIVGLIIKELIILSFSIFNNHPITHSKVIMISNQILRSRVIALSFQQ